MEQIIAKQNKLIKSLGGIVSDVHDVVESISNCAHESKLDTYEDCLDTLQEIVDICNAFLYVNFTPISNRTISARGDADETV